MGCTLNDRSEGVCPPEGGWKASTYYVVDVKCFSSNPAHRTIFYSGFLNNRGNPAGYNCTLSPTSDSKTIDELYYLRVVRELSVEE